MEMVDSLDWSHLNTTTNKSRYDCMTVFVDMCGKGATGLHYDITDAMNRAVPIARLSDPSKPLALWLAVGPTGVEWIRDTLSNMPDTSTTPLSKLELSAAIIYEIRDLAASEGRPDIWVLEQMAGDTMVIPAGILHLVTNLQPCVKIAWDYFKMENVQNYELARDLLYKYIGTAHQPTDTMYHQHVVVNHLRIVCGLRG